MSRLAVIFFAIFTCCSNTIIAQQTASASTVAGVTITTPTSIFKSSDLEFDEIKISTKTGGSVVIQPNGNKSAKGGTSTEGPGAPATFIVSAPPNYTYNISLPKTPVYESDSSSQLMNVSNFTSYPPASQMNTGSQSFSVGATVNVGAAQEQGEYDAEVPFNVTIGYN
jgi:hypothetical protein